MATTEYAVDEADWFDKVFYKFTAVIFLVECNLHDLWLDLDPSQDSLLINEGLYELANSNIVILYISFFGYWFHIWLFIGL